MAEKITTIGLSLLASHLGNGTHLQVDKFVLAYIPGQNPGDAIDPGQGLPPAEQIVHEQAVTKDGYLAPSMVVYSLYMDDTVGPFTFNTIYTVATAENNAVIKIITVPDTPKIATDLGGQVRGQPMVRNAVLEYTDAAAATNITVEAAAWQFAYQKADERVYGITRESTLAEAIAGKLSKVFISPEKLSAWFKLQQFRYAGELAIFTMPELPTGFPGFVLDGSTIPNGVNDFPELAASGSRFITISGNDIVLADAPDFLRGKGSSNRSVGDFENDAMQNITGAIDTHVTATPDTEGAFSFVRAAGSSATSGPHESLGRLIFDASKVVRTADQNQPRSLTTLFAIYHGKVAA